MNERKTKKGRSGYQPPMTPERAAKLAKRAALRDVEFHMSQPGYYPNGVTYEDTLREFEVYIALDRKLAEATR